MRCAPKPGHPLQPGHDIVLGKKVSGGLSKFSAGDTVENSDTPSGREVVGAVYDRAFFFSVGPTWHRIASMRTGQENARS